MKRAIIITAILTLVVGVGGAIWLSANFEQQNAVRAAQEQPQSKSEPSKYDVGPPDPQEILELVNEERKRVGVPPLVVDPRLVASAQLKAADMLDKGYYGHEIPSLGDIYTPEMRSLIYTQAGCSVSGENIHGGDITSRMAVSGWMESSEGHREAILNPEYTKTGIGIVSKNNDSSHDRLDYHYVVQHFCVVK